MIKRPKGPPGRVVVLEHASEVLKGNRLGDPHVRPLHGVVARRSTTIRRFADTIAFPVLYDLVGFTGSADQSHVATGRHSARMSPSAWPDSIHEKKMPPVDHRLPRLLHRARRQSIRQLVGDRQLCRLPDAARSSRSSTRTSAPLASRDHRGCFGKSSGGYGAIVHGMKYPKIVGRDRGPFGRCVLRLRLSRSDWPNTLNALVEVREAEARARRRSTSWRAFRRTPAAKASTTAASPRSSTRCGRRRNSPASDGHAVMNLCMAATYDPDPDGAEWLSHPVRSGDGRADSRRAGSTGWRTIRSTWSSSACGGIALAARHLRRLRLGRPVPHPVWHAHPVEEASHEAGVAHAYEEFDDNAQRTSTTAWTSACRSSRTLPERSNDLWRSETASRDPRHEIVAFAPDLDRSGASEEQSIGLVAGLVLVRVAERLQECPERLAYSVARHLKSDEDATEVRRPDGGSGTG